MELFVLQKYYIQYVFIVIISYQKYIKLCIWYFLHWTNTFIINSIWFVNL